MRDGIKLSSLLVAFFKEGLTIQLSTMEIFQSQFCWSRSIVGALAKLAEHLEEQADDLGWASAALMTRLRGIALFHARRF